MNKQIKRAIHIDFHTMDGIKNFGDEFCAEEFAETLSKAEVNYVTVFGQCNLGYSYYNTKIGVPYPYMKGDMLGDIVRECHKRNITVVGYMNVGFNGQQSTIHKDWCKVPEDNSDVLTMMCLNSKEYRNYVLETIKELLDYGVDGIFCDCMYFVACYCDKCRADMVSLGIDINDKDKAGDFTYSAILSLAKDIRNVVPEDKYLYLNGIAYDDILDCNDHIEVECLPSGGWGYDYFTTQVSYARKLNKNTWYMTGRFQASWGDFGGFKTKAAIENDIYDALCQGVNFGIGDHMHPVKNLDKHIYDTVSDIYKDVKKYEKWTEGTEFYSEIGILRNKSVYKPTSSYMGVSRMLSELKYCYDFINEDMDFDNYSLIILPDEVKLTDKLINKLNNFTQNDGKLLCSGNSAIVEERFALDGFDFIDYVGEDINDNPYYCINSEENPFIWAMYEKGILMLVSAEDVYANYVEPHLKGAPHSPHGLVYNPPAKKTNYAAAAIKNNFAYISFPVFKAYFNTASVFHKELVQAIISKILPNPIVLAKNVPSTARVTVTAGNNYKLVHIKSTFPELRGKTNIIEEHVRLNGCKISIRGKYSSVKKLPDMVKIPVTIKDGYTEFETAEINGYSMFLIN